MTKRDKHGAKNVPVTSCLEPEKRAKNRGGESGPGNRREADKDRGRWSNVAAESK